MSEKPEEKDNLMVIIIGVVLFMAGAMYMVKSAEHEKFAAAQKAIAEDSSNSAYRKDVIHEGGLQK